jgi:hypothetical protein
MINQNTCKHENYQIKEESGYRINPLDRLRIEGMKVKPVNSTDDDDDWGSGSLELVGTHTISDDQVGYCSNCDKQLYTRPAEWDPSRFQGWLENGPEHPYKYIQEPGKERRTLTLRDRYPGLPSPTWFFKNITRHQSDPRAIESWGYYADMHKKLQNKKHPGLGKQFDEITGNID